MKKSRIIIISAAIIFFIVFNFITNDRFLSFSNIKTILSHAVIPTFVTLGMCFIFGTGLIDLSVGAVIIIAANIGGLMAVEVGYFGLIIGAVAVATLLVLFNLKLYLTLKIPSWLLGLGMAMIYETIAMLYSSIRVKAGSQVVDLGKICRELGAFPYNMIMLSVGLATAYFIYYRSTAGLNIRAVGSNGAVSGMMGININRTIIIGGLIGGIFIGFAAAIKESYIGRVMPTSGLMSISEIYLPLAALLLAQALEEVFPRIIGVLISTVFIAAVFNMLTILGVPSGTWQEVVLAVCIIFFGIVSQRKNTGVVK